MARRKKLETEKREEEAFKNLRANIESHQRKMGYTDEDLAQSISCNPLVFRRKVIHPELFKYRELIVVFALLQFTEQEKLESI